MPAPDLKSCQAPSKVIQNCVWYGLKSKTQPFCYKCADGYTSVNGNTCAPNKGTQNVGCLLAALPQAGCQLCDGWDGYKSVQQFGQCAKMSGGIEGDGPVREAGFMVRSLYDNLMKLLD